MWEFMTNYADYFYAGAEQANEIMRVLWAWVITLIPMGFVAMIGLLILQILYDILKDAIKKTKERRQ